METVLTLISLQFKAGARIVRSTSSIKTALRWLVILAVAGGLLAGLLAVFYQFASQFTEISLGIDLTTEFLTFTIAAFMVVQTFFLLPLLIKVLDINNDRELLLKLPLSSRQIFVSKIIVAYIFEIVFCAAILGPILIVYGAVISASWWFYVFVVPFSILFVPIFPFFLAILGLFPMMKLNWFMKNHSLLTIVAYLVLLVAGVVAYMNTVQSMITPLIAGEGFRDTLLENAQGIQSVAKGFYPARAFALLSYGTVAAFFINFGIILAGFLMLAAFAFFVAGLKYKKFYQEEHSFVSNFKSKSGYKAIGPQKAVLKKDILNIFRSSNYTFQFLLIVAITPLLIFYSNRIANFATFQSFNRFGEQGLSFGISFEISLFIVLVLIPLASSFAASNISREGHNIYHTKLIPVSFKKQLLIKTAIVFVPIFVAVTAGALLSMLSHDVLRGAAGGVMPGLSGTDVVVLLVIALFLSLGYISLGTYIDLRRPLCNQIGTGELTKATGHSNFIIILGSLLGVGFGVLGLFSAFNIDVGIRMNHNSFIGFVIAFAVLFGAAFTTLLFVDGERAYKKLEQ